MVLKGTPSAVNKINVSRTYDRMMAGAYFFGRAKSAASMKGTANGQSAQIVSSGGAITSKLALLSTGTFTPNAKPFCVEDDFGNAVEYPSQSEAVAAFLICLALKHDTGDDDAAQEALEEGWEKSGLSHIPLWRDDKWPRLKDKEIAKAIKKSREIKAKDTTVAAAKPALKAEPVENIKATSLLIFKTAEDVARATVLGFNALVAADFEPPLDPAYNRVVLFGSSQDEEFSAIDLSVAGRGAIYVVLPRDKSKMDTAEYFNAVLNMCSVRDASVHKKKTKYVEVPADSEVTVKPTASTGDVTDNVLLNESDIPPFDKSVMEGNIFGEFVHIATDGTTLCPQYSSQLGRLIVAAVLTVRVQYDLISDATPLRRLVLIGETGSGKGASFARARSIITFNGTRYNRDMKITNSVDSGAGLKDMFWDEPMHMPILLYIDEVMSLGHKSSDKKNPDILDTIGELADSTSISRVLSRGRSSKGSASKTLNDAYLTTVMCAQDGMAFMCATAGRKQAGFNDRQIPVFSKPVEAGALPVIPTLAIAEWWNKVQQILADVGTKDNAGMGTMAPASRELVK